MTLDEFRHEMEAYRQAVNAEANEFKYPYLAVERLFALYHKFDAEERRMADQVLTEWVVSEDPDMRFDAQALIRKFEIVKAIPALQQLAERGNLDLLFISAPHHEARLRKVCKPFFVRD